MVCKKLKNLQGIVNIHPLGILLIILGCMITVVVHSAALAKAASEEKEKDQEGNKQGGGEAEGKGEGEEEAQDAPEEEG